MDAGLTDNYSNTCLPLNIINKSKNKYHAGQASMLEEGGILGSVSLTMSNINCETYYAECPQKYKAF